MLFFYWINGFNWKITPTPNFMHKALFSWRTALSKRKRKKEQASNKTEGEESCHRIDNIPVVRSVTRDMRDASLPALKWMSALMSGLFNIWVRICLILIGVSTQKWRRAHVPKAFLFFFSEYVCWSHKRYFCLQNLPEVKLSTLFTQIIVKGRGTFCPEKQWFWKGIGSRSG